MPPTRVEAVQSLKRTMLLDWTTVKSAEDLIDLLIKDVDSDHMRYIQAAKVNVMLDRYHKGN